MYSNVDFERQVLDLFNKYNIKPLYAIIPNLNNWEIRKDASIVKLLNNYQDKNIVDIGIHGYDHKDKLSQLSYSDQDFQIKKAKEIFFDCFENGFEIFCPPWNDINKMTMKLLYNNDIDILSGYLGEKTCKGIVNINCNCNVFDGPLGSLQEKIAIAEKSDNDVLLIALYHTSYDFKGKTLSDLENIIKLLKNRKNVEIRSFSEVYGNTKYSTLVKDSNLAGYYMKRFQYKTYIKCFLKLPIIKNIFNDKIQRLDVMFFSGEYTDIIGLYKSLHVYLVLIISVTIFVVSVALYYIIRRKKCMKSH